MQRCFAFHVWCVEEGVVIGQECTGSRDVSDICCHMKGCVMMPVSNIGFRSFVQQNLRIKFRRKIKI